jgi:hypothetical protein
LNLLHIESNINHSLVDEIANNHAVESGESPTSSSILGPFWSPDAPFRELGASIMVDPFKGGQVTKMHGKVIDSKTGKGLANATVDIWEASTNGKYDFQDPENQSPNNLRGKFRTDAEGNYNFYCLKPTAYSLPRDGECRLLICSDWMLMRYRPGFCLAKCFGSRNHAPSSHSRYGSCRGLSFTGHSNLPARGSEFEDGRRLCCQG